MKTTRVTVAIVTATLVLLWTGRVVRAQDPVKVDPTHYKVQFENDQVRVLRIHYGPHEKSVMHEHPASVVVFLTNAHTKFTMFRWQDRTTESQGRRDSLVGRGEASARKPER